METLAVVAVAAGTFLPRNAAARRGGRSFANDSAKASRSGWRLAAPSENTAPARCGGRDATIWLVNDFQAAVESWLEGRLISASLHGKQDSCYALLSNTVHPAHVGFTGAACFYPLYSGPL